jgi:hypothetical protein
VDGRFEDIRSVWHKEILFALSSGVAVAGAASMGAIRAAECADFGMVGIGEVFRRYAGGDLVDDADVAQAHGPAELNFLPVSEPWVNVDPTLAKMAAVGIISRREYKLLYDEARAIPFRQRTYHAILTMLRPTSGRMQLLTGWLERNAVNQKRIDALELVEWLISTRLERSADRDWVFSQTSHWIALYERLLSEEATHSREYQSEPAES